MWHIVPAHSCASASSENCKNDIAKIYLVYHVPAIVPRSLHYYLCKDRSLTLLIKSYAYGISKLNHELMLPNALPCLLTY